MTRFGDQPDRDKVELDSDETEAFVDIVAEYGAYELVETEVRTNIEVVQEVPAEVDGAPVATPEPPAGLWAARVEAQRAMDLARKNQDTQGILDAHHAWLDLGEEVLAQTRTDTRRLVIASALLGGLGGLGIGAGTVALLIGLVGG